MSTPQVVLLVLGIVVISVVVLGAVFFFVGRATKRRVEELRRELGKDLLLDPEMCKFSGASARFGKVQSTCVLALGSQRLVCRKLAGKDFDIRLDEVAGTRIKATFRGQWTGFGKFLVLDLADKTEVGFHMRNPEAWKAALDKAIAAEI